MKPYKSSPIWDALVKKEVKNEGYDNYGNG